VYEHKSENLLPFRKFLRRLLNHVLAGLAIIAVSLGIGIAGYHFLEGLPWIDALLNASMILGGMGPVDPLKTAAGKVFASGYALFSGVVFLVVVGIMIAPAAHRVLHRLHLERSRTG
jgi:NhaP-type Na+/H+ or K+/H+ antiporter